MKRKQKNCRGKSLLKRPKRPKRRKARALPSQKPEVYHHPVYGDIPLIVHLVTLPSGQTREYRGVDPDFKPVMPKGGVRANILKQQAYYGPPRYYYLDESKTCCDCREQFVFSAKEKKYWYETLQFSFDSHAVRCISCRRKKRRIKGLHRELGRVLSMLKEDAKSTSGLIALAETTLQLWEMTRTGNLERGVAAARKASRLLPEKKEAIALRLEETLQRARREAGLLAT